MQGVNAALLHTLRYLVGALQQTSNPMTELSVTRRIDIPQSSM